MCGLHVEMVKVGGCTMVQWLKECLLWLENVERHLKSGRRLLLYLFTCRAVEQIVAFTRNKSTEHGGEDLYEVVCDRPRLLTGAVLMDEEQGGYRVCSPNVGTEASFTFGREAVRAVPVSLALHHLYR